MGREGHTLRSISDPVSPLHSESNRNMHDYLRILNTDDKSCLS